jgi:uncharacterized protein (TIGR00299 family) protein
MDGACDRFQLPHPERRTGLKTAYFDCFSGISGNMTLGALLHAGLPKKVLLAELKKLPLSGYAIDVETSLRGSLSGTHVTVLVNKKQPKRNLGDILALIEKSRLSPEIKKKSGKVFRLLGRAEAEVHGTDLSSVHFHEVGAVDSIVDIVGSIIGLRELGIGKIVASPVNVGKGTVKSKHGVLPVPAPATAFLLKGKQTYSEGERMELTTPTGAALLAGLASSFGEQPLMKVERIGYGLGSADLKAWPNCLRLMVGEEPSSSQDTCWMIETNIDDMNPELYGHVMDRFFEKGALDVFFTPILMKKGRPAIRLGLLAPIGKEEELVEILFRETTAIGIRRTRVLREKLLRKTIHVVTEHGEVPVKISFLNGDVVNRSPEYEACRELARAKGVPLKEIYRAALRATENQL